MRIHEEYLSKKFTFKLKPEGVVLICSVKKVFLKNFSMLSEGNCDEILVFNKVADHSFIKKRLQYKCFSVNFEKV